MQRQRRWSKEWEHRCNCLRLITVFGRMTITLDQRQKVIRTVGVFFRPPWHRGAAPSCCFCYCSSCGVFFIPLPLDITPSPSLDAGLSYSALPASGAVFSLALCHQQFDPGIFKKKKLSDSEPDSRRAGWCQVKVLQPENSLVKHRDTVDDRGDVKVK